MSIQSILQQYWGYQAFRPQQQEIIESVLAGHDTLALLPTGGGKSICFQVPAMAREGICIVISPLIALMKDQVEQLQRRGIPAVAIYSGMTRAEIDMSLDNCVYGGIKFLYISPERLKTEILIERVKRMRVNLLAVDEAHCISQWGYDFRPAYLEIAQFRKVIPDANVIALTATATKPVQQDIQDNLEFKSPKHFQKSFARPNLSYSVFYEDDKERKLQEILQKVNGSAIVYVRSRKKTQLLAKYLYGHGFSATFYHAGLTNQEREERQSNWINGKTRVMVSTNAFGMGIDKPDVRVVVHMDVPETLEAYYQEAGRAGRDEKKAYAVLLYLGNDLSELQRRLSFSFPTIETLKRVYQCLANYYKIAVGSSSLASYDFDLDNFVKTFQLQPTETYYALKRLEEESLIQLNEDFYHPSKVFIKLGNTELYKFQVANAHLDILIKSILRLYGGELFSNFIAISESKLATLLSTSVNDVMRQLKALHKMEVVDYDQQKDIPQITFLQPRHDAAKIPFDRKKMDERFKIHSEKIKAVSAYATSNNLCRTRHFQEYFGEKAYDDCGVCDTCLNKKKTDKSELLAYPVQALKIYYPQIMENLQKQPATLTKLKQVLQPEKEQEFVEIVKYLLENKELAYDNQGRLYKK